MERDDFGQKYSEYASYERQRWQYLAKQNVKSWADVWEQSVDRWSRSPIVHEVGSLSPWTGTQYPLGGGCDGPDWFVYQSGNIFSITIAGILSACASPKKPLDFGSSSTELHKFWGGEHPPKG